MPKFSMQVLLILVVVSVNSACSHQIKPIQTIYSSNNCVINEQLLKPISSASELDDLLTSFPTTFSKSSTVRLSAASLQVNHQKQSLILFAMGTKPTGGYAIELDSDVATLKGKTLFLPIRIVQPEKDSLQIQMITSPCKIFSIPKADFTEVVLSHSAN